ncbi:hypothetical protein [Longitalea arenae]|uniref:hypothetical protein n=1 Tax=Longitalea arenae TaxID=2812558 RepID=UPI00196703DA|nr:hypothetical protein [Longitalea arenae]
MMHSIRYLSNTPATDDHGCHSFAGYNGEGSGYQLPVASYRLPVTRSQFCVLHLPRLWRLTHSAFPSPTL